MKALDSAVRCDLSPGFIALASLYSFLCLSFSNSTKKVLGYVSRGAVCPGVGPSAFMSPGSLNWGEAAFLPRRVALRVNGTDSVDSPRWAHNRRWMEVLGIQGLLSLKWASPPYFWAPLSCRLPHLSCVPAPVCISVAQPRWPAQPSSRCLCLSTEGTPSPLVQPRLPPPPAPQLSPVSGCILTGPSRAPRAPLSPGFNFSIFKMG